MTEDTEATPDPGAVDPDGAGARDLFHRHEYLMDGASEHLMAAVNARRQRRRNTHRAAYATVVLAVVATLGGVAALVHRDQGRSSGTPTITPAVTAAPPSEFAPKVPAPPGFRVESSLGMEIAVPAGWRTNDYGCGQDAQPTVVRGAGMVPACLTATPPRKEVADITAANVGVPSIVGTGTARLIPVATTVDGVPAMRASGRVAGDMYVGSIVVASRDVAVHVRTRTAATLATILSSVHLVDVDHFGCATRAPATRPAEGGASTFIDPSPATIAVCYYGGNIGGGRLQASTWRTGTNAGAVAAAIDAEPPGTNPDAPADQCGRSASPPLLDILLIVRGASGKMRQIAVTFDSCTDRRMDNGDQFRQIDDPLLGLIMAGMDLGFGGPALGR